MYSSCVLRLRCGRKPLNVAGMRLIPSGEFVMGTDDPQSMPNERPAHGVRISAFWIDEHDVTNAEFRRFVEATGYLTTAERPVDWEDIKRQLAPGTPKPPDEMLKPGSLVFTPPDHPVDTRDMANWWTWTTGASWKHPQGPLSDISSGDTYIRSRMLSFGTTPSCTLNGRASTSLTEAEWDWLPAVRGAKTNTRYIWGNEFKPEVGSSWQTPSRETSPSAPLPKMGMPGWAVGEVAFPANGYGLSRHGGKRGTGAATSTLTTPTRSPSRKASAVILPGPTRSSSLYNPLCGRACNQRRLVPLQPQLLRKLSPDAARGTPSGLRDLEHVGFRCAADADDFRNNSEDVRNWAAAGSGWSARVVHRRPAAATDGTRGGTPAAPEK